MSFLSFAKSLRPAAKPPVRTRRLRIDALEERRLLSVTRFVDDDKQQFPNSQFTSIQAAVTASAPGDVIRVAPGVYNESVTVDKRLTILGAFSNDNGSDGTRHHAGGESVVNASGTGSAGFALTANDIVINGFEIEGAAGSTAGITMDRTTSGDRILSNRFENNTAGINLAGNGNHSTLIQGNIFRNNNAAGAATGNGIYSDQGFSDVTINRNYFTAQTNAAMIFVGGGTGPAGTDQSHLDIENNLIINDAAVILANVNHATLNYNTDLNSNGSGIFLAGGDTDIHITNNLLRNGAFTGINSRFLPGSYNVAVVNSNMDIRGNTVTGFGDAGIRLRDGTNATIVANNLASRNGKASNPDTDPGEGISIEDSSGNTLVGNGTFFNGRDGIGVYGTSSQNNINNNTSRYNGRFDYRDETGPGGIGTAGTNNFYHNNRGKKFSPPALKNA